MHDPAFVALAVFLRPEPAQSSGDAGVEDAPPVDADELAETVAAVRCFRAALADALDVAVQTLLADIAAGVLARELELAPSDIAGVVARARERFASEDPLVVRVHPGDLARLAGAPFTTVADERLRRGDVTIELHSGTIDARLGTRLDAVLRAYES